MHVSVSRLEPDQTHRDRQTGSPKATGLKPKRTSIQSPCQNGTAERWAGGCRRELLDYVIPLNEEHLRRLMREYICYFHEDRTHDGLGKDPTESPSPRTEAVSEGDADLPPARLGGLHHPWRQTA